jgi:hypothetical protein
VALVLRGEEGVGKGVFVKNFGKLFGAHFLPVTQTRHLTGNFNSQLKDKLLVFSDEGFWAGDKSAEGTLKALITEDSHIIELKGVDSFEVKNYIRLIVASNNDWLVPAGATARRFCVIDVQPNRKGDFGYFAAIEEEMKSGGWQALMHFLQSYDLSDINLRDFPKTDAFREQQIFSMSPFRQRLLVWLSRGYIAPGNGWDGWLTIDAEVLFQTFLTEANQAGYKLRAIETMIGRELKKLFPTLQKNRLSLVTSDGRRNTYTFPPLNECRKQFEAATGVRDWPKEQREEAGEGLARLFLNKLAG